MRILALDQATAISGYAVLEDGVCIKSGTIDLSKDKNSERRIGRMMTELCNAIGTSKFDLVIFEDIQKQVNISTYKSLARIQGAIMLWCYYNGIEFSYILPTAWRKKLGFHQGGGIKSKELKQQAISYVKDHCKELNREIGSDEADAICIGLSYFADTDSE